MEQTNKDTELISKMKEILQNEKRKGPHTPEVSNFFELFSKGRKPLEDEGKVISFQEQEHIFSEHDREKDPLFAQNVECDLSNNEKLILIKVFTGWTGLQYEINPKTNLGYSEEEILQELNNIRSFLGVELNVTLGISGRLADINKVMFMNEFDGFTEQELISYVKLFHIDVEALNDFQDQLQVQYSKLYVSKEVSRDDLFAQQEFNEQQYLTKLKQLILHEKVMMMDRLRLWRWREEVLLSRVGDELTAFPGAMSMFQPETSSVLLENGIQTYYYRVGEAKREILMERYTFFDIYHMAGKLALAVPQDVLFNVDMKFEDLTDLLLLIIDELAIDPRHILTPLGVQLIFNREYGEVVFNLSHKKKEGHDKERLELACTHAGIKISAKTEYTDGDGNVLTRNDDKPTYVLVEELTCQYLSPQFYSSIEGYRDVASAIINIKTLNEKRVISGMDDKDLAKDVIFYGIGDGLSMYEVFTARELADTFLDTENFFNPYSIVRNPNDPQLWQRFSQQSIERLLKIVIPRLERKPQDVKAIDDLKQSIMDNLDSIDIADSDTVGGYLKPRERHRRIIKRVMKRIQFLRGDIGLFLSFLFNLGKQFSDWETDMTRISENSIESGIINDYAFKMVDPEWSINLTEKIFHMSTLDVEKYIHIKDSESGTDYAGYFRELRLVKFYRGAYRIDWNDELATIHGQLNRIVQANKLGLYEFIKTSGNWFICTANYYSSLFLGTSITNQELSLSARPTALDEFRV